MRKALHSSRNLEVACCLAWHSCQRHQHEHFNVLGANLRTDSYSYWWKPNTKSTSYSLSLSLAMVILCLYSSSHMVSCSLVRSTSSAWWRQCCPGLTMLQLEGPMSCNRTLHHATKERESSLGSQKISMTTSPLTSGCLTPQIAISLIIICGMQLTEKLKEKLKVKIIASFTNLNKETFSKACRNFRSYLAAVVVIFFNKFNL